jgi:transposase
VLVEAAWHAARTAGPLRAFHQRVAARRGGNIATVAVARKLAVIACHLLSHREDDAFARPSLTREKIRKLELATGAERQKGKRIGVWATKEQHRLDNELAAQAELAYRRLVRDWQPTIKGTGAAPGRASCGPSSGQAARQATAPPLRFSSRSPATPLSQRSRPPSST